jgi:uncharacterized membrane protein YdjX (TVP38/TMEM64 family)
LSIRDGRARDGVKTIVPERHGPVDRQAWLIAGLVLTILVGALILWGQPLYRFVADQAQVRAWVEGLSAWGPLAIVGLEIAQVLLAPIPGQAIDAVSGYLFGIWLGSLYAAVGIGLGSLINFGLARRFGRPLVAKMVKPDALARLDDLADRGGALFFFLIWLFPFVPDDLACLACGLTRMSWRQFLILMTLGRLPGIVVATWIGANAAQIRPAWWIAVLAVITLAAIVVWHWGEQIQNALLRFISRVSRTPDR